MNPPYSCPGLWMKKLCAEFESGRVREAIALVPAATDTKWLSPVLKTQPVCFWTGRIKFLDEDYQPKLSARQSHVLVYWGDNWESFREVFDKYGVVYLPLEPKDDGELDKSLLGDKQDNNPSNLDNSPSKIISPSNLLRDNEENSPSKNSSSNNSGDEEKNSPELNISPSKKRSRGEGNGYIHWRTITKNGNEYPQAYYHWKKGDKKRSKYIPKKLLGVVEEADSAKHPVMEILKLLGVGLDSHELLGNAEGSPSNREAYANIESIPDKLLGDKWTKNGETNISQGIDNSPSNLHTSPSKTEFSPSKRRKGDGSGSIHWRTITRGGKDYPQAYYHYEFWKNGDRDIKSSKYIPKRLLSQVQLLESEKAPVREILRVLGIYL
ncbi:MAG: hypothetical protein HC836_42570 [Richelia sp. RM2_1_2]|nr:hypothetical protein [Richelia sp. SM2_1_7]NJM19112.1 hypothetical protein [Richelia sp. SM1_7_0]NJN11387.1 hypothetical protein [Richelia sp. RM1_1_1]NJO28900.1 hypothetical protein [Richelia sp. SL_2_1]NJO64593.1 hypothetical protein [Richelia sp. RM2_1_2]